MCNMIKIEKSDLKLTFDALYPAAELAPEFRDGRLWLRFAPKPKPMSSSAISVNTTDQPRRLPTGVRLHIPEGYAAHICQVEQLNGKNRYIVDEILFGNTDEVEVIYRASQSHYVSPGRVIGVVILVEMAKYGAEKHTVEQVK